MKLGIAELKEPSLARDLPIKGPHEGFNIFLVNGGDDPDCPHTKKMMRCL